MIDIHSHLIYGVDDGADTVEESIEMIKRAKEVGINAIIATPHYNPENYEKGSIQKNFKITYEAALKHGIKLFLGYEAKIDPSLPEQIKSGRSITLNNSPFLLVELPFFFMPIYTKDTLYRLNLMGIRPIIAHPERNKSFVDGFELFKDYVEMGCLMQLDIASIIGVNGWRVKKFSQKALKEHYITFIASDSHDAKGYLYWYNKALNKVKKWVGEEYAQRLFSGNAYDSLFAEKLSKSYTQI